MKTIIAQSGQTLFDLSVQELGGVEAVWELLDANSFLQLDLAIPAGARVVIPEASMVNRRVAQYFAAGDLHPVSGLGEEVIITQNDLNTMKQDLNYNLAAGSHEFPRVRLNFLHDQLTVQVAYTGITADTVVVSVDQSLDGVVWTTVPWASQVLDKTKPAHTFNIIGLLTDFVRLHVEIPDASAGTIDNVIWKT